MAFKTYYAVQPIRLDREGNMAPGAPILVANEFEVWRRCKALADVEGGAWGFARTGDPFTGQFGFARMICRYGRVAEGGAIPVIGMAS